ncbi:uncharacterized protein An06g01800 [Aspergillus niger]|uniref:Contig An06c0090, genomic contig n=2 Tax=Aspergillus niger TaxID=5061 RepID=A2QLM8_ASPNC|nr:uncharacterized protein An06g01800 [Aspergillus niger]CAK48023.1 unnamed protein product [Aspergillus niger]
MHDKTIQVRREIEIKPIARVTCGSSAGVWLSPREICSDVLLVTHPPDFRSGPTTEEKAKEVQLS